MSSAEATSEEPATPMEPFVPEDALREVVSEVLALRAPQELSGGPCDEAPLVLAGGPDATRMESVGVDSLLIAEIIVELEQRLDTLLELHSGTRLETFADLRAALRPAVSA